MPNVVTTLVSLGLASLVGATALLPTTTSVSAAPLPPTSSHDGLTIPAADPAMAFVAPTPDQPNYQARLQVYLQAVVPQPFLDAYTSSGGVDVLGLPTSGAATDPSNPNFSYQRFQNGVLFHNATADTTTALPLDQ
jgi:hypothetical protein